MKRLVTVVVFLIGVCELCYSQTADTIREISVTPVAAARPDTLPRRFDWQKAAVLNRPFPVQSFILPAAMIAYGVTAVHNGALQKVNASVKEQIWEDNPHKPFHLDNYLMFTPTLAVYALNAAGIHGEHNFKDRTIILLMANVIANGTVFSVKGWSHEMRPDGSDYQSFPSGHTAEAFAGAEFMREEYKDVSPWYGIAGYAAATATGMLRMYNDKHWASDVIAGAGVGIASTRLAYWLYPKMQRLFGKKEMDPEKVSMLMPTYQSGSVGLAFVKTFK
jgi:PAP2 superfamily